MDIKTLFGQALPKAIATVPDKARELNAVYQFRVTGEDGGDWAVDLKSDPPSCTATTREDADCTIEVSAEDMQALLDEPAVGMQLYMEGKLRVEGDPMLATRLQELLNLSTEVGG